MDVVTGGFRPFSKIRYGAAIGRKVHLVADTPIVVLTARERPLSASCHQMRIGFIAHSEPKIDDVIEARSRRQT